MAVLADDLMSVEWASEVSVAPSNAGPGLLAASCFRSPTRCKGKTNRLGHCCGCNQGDSQLLITPAS